MSEAISSTFPRAIRAWPDMKMNGFDKNAMSDSDIDAVVDFLGYMAGRRH
jgi:hypothetical protein